MSEETPKLRRIDYSKKEPEKKPPRYDYRAHLDDILGSTKAGKKHDVTLIRTGDESPSGDKGARPAPTKGVKTTTEKKERKPFESKPGCQWVHVPNVKKTTSAKLKLIAKGEGLGVLELEGRILEEYANSHTPKAAPSKTPKASTKKKAPAKAKGEATAPTKEPEKKEGEAKA